MKFWASCETFRTAYPALVAVRSKIEPLLNAEFVAHALADLNAELRYIPIVMPAGLRDRYPARSAPRKKERLYVCAPQLNYDVFVDGTFEAQLHEYIRGIGQAAPHLAGLGATPQQIEEFQRILAFAAEKILADHSNEADS